MLTSILAADAGHSTVASSPLTAAIVLPFIGALLVACIPKSRAELHRVVTVLDLDHTDDGLQGLQEGFPGCAELHILIYLFIFLR